MRSITDKRAARRLSAICFHALDEAFEAAHPPDADVSWESRSRVLPNHRLAELGSRCADPECADRAWPTRRPAAVSVPRCRRAQRAACRRRQRNTSSYTPSQNIPHTGMHNSRTASLASAGEFQNVTSVGNMRAAPASAGVGLRASRRAQSNASATVCAVVRGLPGLLRD